LDGRRNDKLKEFGGKRIREGRFEIYCKFNSFIIPYGSCTGSIFKLKIIEDYIMREVTLQILLILQQEFKGIGLSELLEKTQAFIESIKLEKEFGILLANHIAYLELSNDATDCLVSADILTIGELVQESRESLRQIPFLFESYLPEIEDALKVQGLKLKEEEPVKFTSNCEYQ
jgi:hypothetical protein